MQTTSTKTSALVLGHLNFSDTSLINRLYTSELGKISVLSKGARKKGGSASKLDLFRHIKLEVRSSSRSELYSAGREVEIVDDFAIFSRDLKRYACAAYTAELIEKSVEFNDPDERFFNFCVAFFQILANCPQEKLWISLRFFETRLLFQVLGAGLNDAVKIPDKARGIVDYLASNRLDAVFKLSLSAEQKKLTESLLRSLLDFHLEKTLKSLTFLKQFI